jgi:UDP-glucose 4-epimerase
MRRILVTGAATWTGGTLIQRLEDRSDLQVFAVDDIEPSIEFSSVFERLSLDRLDFARYVLDVKPHTVVHLQTVDRTAELGRARAHEENVVGAQALFGAIGRSPTTEHVVVKSDSAVYGASPRNPSVLSESAQPRGRPDHYQRDLAEMERFVHDVAERHDVAYTVLRFAPILGSKVGNPMSRYLTLPGMPTLLGFDPRLQFVHEDDAVRAIEHALDAQTPGTFNVAATGQLYLSRILRLGLRLPQPLPKRAFAAAMRGLAGIGLFIPEHTQSLLKHGRVIDTTAMRDELRFVPKLTCRQTVLAAYGRLPQRGAA